MSYKTQKRKNRRQRKRRQEKRRHEKHQSEKGQREKFRSYQHRQANSGFDTSRFANLADFHRDRESMDSFGLSRVCQAFLERDIMTTEIYQRRQKDVQRRVEQEILWRKEQQKRQQPKERPKRQDPFASLKQISNLEELEKLFQYEVQRLRTSAYFSEPEWLGFGSVQFLEVEDFPSEPHNQGSNAMTYIVSNPLPPDPKASAIPRTPYKPPTEVLLKVSKEMSFRALRFLIREAAFQHVVHLACSSTIPKLYGILRRRGDGVLALVCERIEGTELGDNLDHDVEWKIQAFQSIFEVCWLQQYLRIDHHDLHLGNILVRSDKTILIIDFGLAHVHSGTEENQTNPSQTNFTSPSHHSTSLGTQGVGQPDRQGILDIFNHLFPSRGRWSRISCDEKSKVEDIRRKLEEFATKELPPWAPSAWFCLAKSLGLQETRLKHLAVNLLPWNPAIRDEFREEYLATRSVAQLIAKWMDKFDGLSHKLFFKVAGLANCADDVAGLVVVAENPFKQATDLAMKAGLRDRIVSILYFAAEAEGIPLPPVTAKELSDSFYYFFNECEKVQHRLYDQTDFLDSDSAVIYMFEDSFIWERGWQMFLLDSGLTEETHSIFINLLKWKWHNLQPSVSDRSSFPFFG